MSVLDFLILAIIKSCTLKPYILGPGRVKIIALEQNWYRVKVTLRIESAHATVV